jgi:hypothetical protein
VEIEVMKQAPALPVAKRENLRAAYVLSVLVAVLATFATVVGLRFPTVYGDKAGRAMAFGNDLPTLVVAVPLLALAIIYSARGSVRARLLWLGALYYMFYNYAFYVFLLPVTKLYLPIVAIFALSLLALALGVGNLDVEAIGRRFRSRTPAKLMAAYMFVWAAMVGGLWISQWVRFLITGKVPNMGGSENAYQVIAAVDLSFMLSLLIQAAYWLWRRRPWGYVMAVVLNVQGALYTAVMGAICVFGWMDKPGTRLVSPWFIICVVFCTGSLLCLAALLLNVKRPAEV